MHIGPAKTYETKWLYQRAGLPVEITAEFENWRRIRDSDGTEGWVYHSLLSGKRTGMVIAKTPDDLVPVYEKSDVESAVVAKLERGVVGTVKRCTDGWCAIKGPGYEWVGPAGPVVGCLSEREGGLRRQVAINMGALLVYAVELADDRRFHRSETFELPGHRLIEIDRMKAGE